ncbi:DUF2332 domain-containing protein [Nocardioides aurantiacus]|uniref:DUF2332 family protein n=1 Tax=Nocardioides aurantiacus TaxID=86796 RepID=A0A3N2CY70_9ACTN|nr:DUF2332 domain-containing protein [Nocardioides aurantiacus]ROR92403.1 hypothetical protein EDD33_3293 [Nocardioides aurantiacus]
MRPDEALRRQGEACAALGSPMYADLLARLADDVAAGGPTARVLAGHEDLPAASALALRLLGSVHRLVLERRAGAVGVLYPSVGGTWDPVGGPEAVLALLSEQPDAVREWLDRPPQTNEVGRSATLVGGLLHLEDDLRLPVRLAELGCSAGLNLLADQYAVGDGSGLVHGRPSSVVRLERGWAGRRLRPWPGLRFVERAGCDPRPIDPRSTAGRLALTAYVWPDQVDRLERLRGALAVAAAADPPDVRQQPAGAFLDDLRLREGTTTVVWHSVVRQYLDAGEQQHLDDRVERLGSQATPTAPLAHLTMEPAGERGAGTPGGFPVELRTWSGRPGDGEPRVLGHAVPHGLPTTWA